MCYLTILSRIRCATLISEMLIVIKLMNLLSVPVFLVKICMVKVFLILTSFV